MNVGWTAGAIRGKALARRALGPTAARNVAAKASLSSALRLLADSTYGQALEPDMELERGQRAITETVLWHLRVLAGWLPPHGVRVVRAFVGWFEARDLEELAVSIATASPLSTRPYALGNLATVRARGSSPASLSELRSVLALSEWGDPGGNTLPEILLGLRLGWARLLKRALPEHPEWGNGSFAVCVAKALFLDVGEAGGIDPRRVPELEPAWMQIRDIGSFAERLPPTARWPLSDVGHPSDLWRAEHAWWLRLEKDASSLLRRAFLGRPMVVGAAATLLADGWRAAAALAHAARASSNPEVAIGPA